MVNSVVLVVFILVLFFILCVWQLVYSLECLDRVQVVFRLKFEVLDEVKLLILVLLVVKLVDRLMVLMGMFIFRFSLLLLFLVVVLLWVLQLVDSLVMFRLQVVVSCRYLFDLFFLFWWFSVKFIGLFLQLIRMVVMVLFVFVFCLKVQDRLLYMLFMLGMLQCIWLLKWFEQLLFDLNMLLFEGVNVELNIELLLDRVCVLLYMLQV